MRKIFALFIISFACLILGSTTVSAQASPTRYYWTFEGAQSITVGSQTKVRLMIDSGTKQLAGADLLLNYDATKIGLTAEVAQPKLFDTVTIAQVDSDTIRISGANNNIGNFFTGNSAFVIFTVQGKVAGTSTTTPTCTAGGTNDSNLVERLTGVDLLSCPIPGFSLTVTNPTPTPTPVITPRPATPTPTVTPRPPTPTASPSIFPVCLNITRDVAAPTIGSQVRFTCGSVANATSYGFRYKILETGETGTITTASSTSNITVPFTIAKNGTFDVECRVCALVNGTTACSPYTAW